MKGYGNILKQAQQMQSQLMKVQEEAAHKTAEATSGGGMVKAVANGAGDLISISMEKEVVDPTDIGMLEDLVVAAVNEALKKARELMAEEMKKVTGGLNMPGLF